MLASTVARSGFIVQTQHRGNGRKQVLFRRNPSRINSSCVTHQKSGLGCPIRAIRLHLRDWHDAMQERDWSSSLKVLLLM